MAPELSGLDVAEALLAWQPGLGRVQAALDRLRSECEARVERREENRLAEAFDQIGGFLGVAKEELERLSKRRSQAEE